ncbi:TRAP transporter small permease [Rhodoligotrophos defluvii]|uniref:TRAP transporter small permease n=1 Tax=Rhodoligotrophos defluvii TaxID=2561934 RepID=UPI0010C94850|nr:TRAP transporter small permease [Rhodoligotrophos defluvii]
MRFWKAIWRFEWGLAAIGAGICLLAMTLITVISVFGRYILQADLIPGAYNIIERIIFPLLVFWALPMAHREGSFPRLDILANALAPWPRAFVSAIVLLVEIAVYAVVLWYVCNFVWNGIASNRTMQVGTDFWPLWPIIIMMPLAFALMLLEMVRLLAADIRTLFGISAENEPAAAEATPRDA